ncbi:MAG: hypothetical protein ACMG6E_04130, partial [Candidatus Roizmanbacteria bacterium]
PFLKKIVDPSLYPHDPYFDLKQYHYSYFWYLFIPFYKMGILEPVLFIVHIFAEFFTLLGIWFVAKVLFDDDRIANASVLILMLPHLSFGGFPLIEFQVINRTVILPFLLYGIVLFLQKKYIRSFILLGILYNFHALSVHFVLAPFGLYYLIDWKHVSIKTKLLSTIGFILSALPVFAWKFSNSRIELATTKEWFDMINLTLLHTVFTFWSPLPLVIILSTGGIGIFALYWYLVKKLPERESNPMLTTFIMGSAIACALGFLFSQWIPLTFIIQFQLVRAVIIALILVYISYAAYVYRQFDKKKIQALDLMILLTSALVFFSPLLLLIYIPIFMFVRKKYKFVAVIITLFIFFGGLMFSRKLQTWQPGIHIYSIHDSWYDTQKWAKDNSAKDSVFIVPPEKWWMYELGWHVESERSTVFTSYELLELAFVPSYTKYFVERLDDVAPHARAKFNGDVFYTRKLLHDSYYGQDENHWRYVGAKYGAKYFVAEKPKRYTFPVVYENKGYRVYMIK